MAKVNCARKSRAPLWIALAALFSVPLLTSFSAPFPAWAEAECGRVEPCQIGSRSYYARPPDSPESGGKNFAKMPVLLHFHGWGRQGRLIVNHRRIAGATRSRGVLLLAPNGEGRSWDFWSPHSEDIDFAVSVLKDAAKRWPIDENRIFVSGYSYGSAMAWRFACAEGERVASLLAVSGSLPDQSESCAHAVNVRHVHGTRDNVMDFPFAPDGAVGGAIELWRVRNECATEPSRNLSWHTIKILPITRYFWENCRSRKTIILDVHNRGHFIPRRWIAHQLDELLGESL